MSKTRLVVIAACFSALGTAASAGPREETLAILGELPAGDPELLETWVNAGDSDRIALGERVIFHFRSQRDGYLTVAYIDNHGTVTLLLPSEEPEASRILTGEDKIYPSGSTQLTSQLPLGSETLFAMVTPEAIPRERFGVDAPPGELLVVDAADAPDFARRLVEIAKSHPPGSLATARFDQRVVAAATPTGTQYTVRGIVRYFTETPRAIRRPKLDLDIKFAFGSDQLTEEARHELDVVGEALTDPQLAEKKFVLGGHTDDVGSDAYNETLSVRRAEAARSYVAGKWGVDPARLGSTGYGESQPLVPGVDDDARQQNRRVVLELIR